MCGIAGIFAASYPEPELQTQIRRMTATLAHRGPDSDGILVRGDQRLAFGHRRLAIQDLSEAGAQPMTSPSGRYTIVYNGEIYNAEELKSKLTRNIQWRGHSDTEILLCAFEELGVVETIRLAVGMFAIALYDDVARKLYLIRDRFGEKPLYYAMHRGGLVFASELKGLLALPDLRKRVCRDAVVLLLRHNYIPAPYTILEGVKKLSPATVLVVESGRVEAPREERYWDPAAVVTQYGTSRTVTRDFEESVAELRDKLRQSVRGQLVSDVPIGAFLSGGIDSSLICAIMQEQSPVKINTYTIGFHEPEFDEAGFARQVAQRIGTNHSEYYVSANDALALVEKLPTIFDEPFADSSQLPTLLLSQMAARNVKVALSGDAGDELFAGYARYRTFAQSKPLPGMRLLSRALLHSARGEYSLGYAGHALTKALGACYRLPRWIIEDRLKRHLVAAGQPLADAYPYLTGYWSDPGSITQATAVPSYALSEDVASVERADDYREMMLSDVYSYLPDDILVKVDRAAMNHSLETRAPFLDHRLYEYSVTLPTEFLVDEKGTGKRILRHLLGQYVPDALVDRPKAGFAAPLAKWLRNDLAEWAESLIYGPELAAQSFMDTDRLKQVWQLHRDGRRDYSFHLWGLLQLCAWQRMYGASW
jgi:asparagine synthase (glutamine-hydrolysing)